ncbi:cis-prenyltransferase 4, chloroplastic-like [Panicum virgatum]|uniref:cis-prenyltransferase 4, chloroplastic-like n=1 Tax=Panicum virgatum TaxID=38727 RepID=UPI0019D5971B|nr:cis-prenyltransferase 4, chloroplastic-like [Panicum virgatum]
MPARRSSTAAPAAEAALLPAPLRAESLPRHVAVVMDGNARWARARGLPSAAGHEAGRRALEETVRLSRAWGVRALTAFAFSHENWSRPKVELEFVMGLFERVIHESVAGFLREGIWLRVIGDSSRLPVSLQKTAREAEEATRNNSQLDLTLAISYSGRRDIVQACRSLEAEQLPAVAVGVLGALLHGHAVARLRGGRLPGGPGLLPEQGEAVRCQEIVAQT